jgi:hypothetical protein
MAPQSHSHHHAPHTHAPRALAPTASLLRLSAASRLAGAAGMALVLWALVDGALLP